MALGWAVSSLQCRGGGLPSAPEPLGGAAAALTTLRAAVIAAERFIPAAASPRGGAAREADGAPPVDAHRRSRSRSP
eukprot:10296371-Alexandrium_andersonii.AAC.1